MRAYYAKREETMRAYYAKRAQDFWTRTIEQQRGELADRSSVQIVSDFGNGILEMRRVPGNNKTYLGQEQPDGQYLLAEYGHLCG